MITSPDSSIFERSGRKIAAPALSNFSPFFQQLYKTHTDTESFIRPTPFVRSFSEILYEDLIRIQRSPIFFQDVNIPEEKHSCISPITVFNGPHSNRAPCRQCLECRIRETYKWLNRFKIESIGQQSFFITLTYNEHYVSVLNSREYQNYLKRIRKHLGPIVYAVIGEYGPRHGRPHYHLLVYVPAELDQETVIKHLTDAWPYGIIDIEVPTPGHLRYIASYTKSHFVAPESFRRFSLKHAIGRSSLQAQSVIQDIVRNDFEPLPSDSGPISLPLVSSAEKLKYNVITPAAHERSVEEFFTTYDQTSSLNSTYSIEYLHSYIQKLQLSYDKFINTKLE